MPTPRAGRRPDQVKNIPISAGKTYFLGIGINAYTHWPRLRNAVRDVQAIAGLLQKDYGLSAENVTLLLEEEATREGILRQLESLAQRVRDPDSLIIYYAGHGHLNDRQRGFWVPVDATKEGLGQYIRNSTLREYIGDIPTRHTLLISDACFSGSLFVRGERSASLAAAELAQLPSRWAICSGRHDEAVADGPAAGHSPFAQSLLDVLGQTSRAYLTANFLLEQVRDQTRANYEQLPDGGPLQGVGHKRGQYVFQRVGERTPTPITAPLAEPATVSKPPSSTGQKRRKRTFSWKWGLGLGIPLLALMAWGLIEWINNSGPDEEPFVNEAPVATLEGAIGFVYAGREVAAGSYHVGNGEQSELWQDPKLHEVRLDKFGICRFEVTFAQYDMFCEDTKRPKPDDMGWGRDGRPVINVSWFDALYFCNWLSLDQGGSPVYTFHRDPQSNELDSISVDWDASGFRLPTEAEWEVAARQGDKFVQFGNGENKADPSEMNFNASEQYQEDYSVVGEYREKTLPLYSMNHPNGFKLYHMSGNVQEWCWDGMQEVYPVGTDNPRGPANWSIDSARVVRGGSFMDGPADCRVYSRRGISPYTRAPQTGFRLVRTGYW